MYTDIHIHGSYIILISGPCTIWLHHFSRFLQQLNELMFGNNTKDSWNPRVKFVVPVMSNCTHFENKLISTAILENIWILGVMNAAVLFLKSNEHGGNNLQQNTTDSAQGAYVELHT